MSDENENTCYKCGYCRWIFADHCENYLLHTCFQKFSFENGEELVADADEILSVASKEGDILSPNPVDASGDLDEQLISLVASRKALFDASLPLIERTYFKKKNLWNEVENNLGGQMKQDDIKARWKYLRDCYIKAKRKVTTYKASGSGATNTKVGFRFFLKPCVF
ncbi:unnamed protein product [Psylliodes chrysocephalus]|uniref:MADF domain-containing protein n=1 Tax=Psylliodes chrysocephalus TaxID=3402493 RepID=A0A9P0G937_9CUCU|nr:unnamed protein product [Psylliodes chrysocephala]